MQIAYYAPFATKTGYAQAAHDYMLALHRAGVSLRIVPTVPSNASDLDERYAELIPLVTNPTTEAATHVIAHAVPSAVPNILRGITKDIATIAITTWETTHAPADMIEALDKVSDLIIVPSLFCASTLSEAKTDIEIVPHCFDPEHWPVSESPPSDSPYSFYSVLSWNERKNPIGLLKAYLSEFTSDDDVVLNLKVSGYSEEDLIALVQATNIPIDRLPALEIIPEYFDHEGMLDFHDENHCFVTAARGEGWNLPAFEAALAGRPVITHGFGGQMQYLSPYTNLHLYDYHLTPAIAPPVIEAPIEIAGLQIRPVTQTAPSGITAHQSWAEPDLHGLQKAMRACYEDRARVDHSSRKALEDRFCYDTVGAQLVSLLERTLK